MTPFAPGTPINILIVDDEPRNLTVLETLLDNPDYRLVRAGSADEALLALMTDEYALLILDIRMPGMTGFELAQTIKSRRKTAGIPIIFLTAYYNEDQHVAEGYGSGAVDFLQKPVQAAVLRSKVAVFAELHRKSRELALVNAAQVGVFNELQRQSRELERANSALAAEVRERRSVESQLRELNAVLDQRVTERTQALSASDARLRLATEAVGLGIWSWQLDDDVWVWENDWFVAALGVQRSKVPLSAARIAIDFMHDDDRMAFEQAIGAVMRDNAALDFEARLYAADGSLRWVEFVGKRSDHAGHTGHTCHMLGTTRDTTERRRAEETLRERERFLSTVTAAARIGLAVIEPGDVYRYTNDAYAQMFGRSVDAVTGRPVSEVLGSDGWALAQPSLQRAFAGERVSFEFTLAPLAPPAPDQRQRHFGAFHEPHLDPLGTRTVAVVVVEITALKQLESELRDTDRRKDEFLATLAHELRNPLAPVRNAVRILQLADPPNRQLAWARDVIDRQVHVMARLIDDLMDVSRINQGRIELRRESVELAKVLEWAVEASRPQIDEFGHLLVLDLPPQPVLLEADLTRLSQVFMNLLINAAKYTDRGGQIEVRALHQGSEVVVTVKDNGIGMPPDRLRSVFVMFAQAEDAVARSRGGLGIGLSLAKRLIEMHGGSIEALSAGPGQGSEFVVRLPTLGAVAPAAPQPHPRHAPPAAPAPAVAAPAPAAVTAGGHPALRIVVVDDNRDGADTLAALLSMIGHEVHIAYDGEDAVRAAAEFRPQVMLLDIGLPKLSGYDACRRIREAPQGKAMTLIAMTGWGDAEARRKASLAGFDRHLVKPVDETLLLSMLSEVMPSAHAATPPPAL